MIRVTELWTLFSTVELPC